MIQLKCQVPEHHNKFVEYFCINQNCNQFRVQCYFCYQNGDHFSHPKDVFQMAEFQDFLQQQFNQNEELLRNLQKVINNVQMQLENLKRGIQVKFNMNKEKLQCLNVKQLNDWICDYFKFQIESSQSFKYVEQNMKDIQQTIFSIISDYNLQTLQEQHKQQQCSLSLQNQLQLKEKDWKNIRQELLESILTSSFQKQLTFSSEHKHRDAVVSNNGKIVECGGSCLCDQLIPTHQVTKFAFKILNSKACYVGIGIKQVMQETSYNYVGLNQGSYLIRNDQHSYSHNQQRNNNKLSFHFSDNDIIIIEVDIQKKNIKWTKFQSGESFNQQICSCYDLYPCIRSGSDSKVKILGFDL
ncbi:unnamed protein product [Paramecium sonneborni]|uniref:Uncharacterized protein n=1 Tax=Paramecium sonneborni TaxID=65129 RepID=A0A8S1PRB9_9CILI|nr:unnamed protein product [Paramecium sonneborni]